MLSYDNCLEANVAYAHRTGLRPPLWRLAPEMPEALVAASFGMVNGHISLPQSLLFGGQAKRLIDYEIGAHDWGSAGSVSRAQKWLASLR